jgi:hypothetical protein
MKNASANQSAAKQVDSPLGLDPDFELALDAFATAAKETMDELFKRQFASLETRIGTLSEKAAAMPALLKRATAAEQRVAALESELRDAREAARTAGGRSSPRIEPPVSAPELVRPQKPKAKRKTTLPRSPTLGDVIRFLSERGFKPKNNRPLGGGVWVFADSVQFAAVLSELRSVGVGVTYHPKGRSREPGRPQYEIDPAKVLAD